MTRARDFADVISGNFAIPTGSLGNAIPADGSITTAKLADDAITSAKIADDAVVSAAIATNAVASDALNITSSDLPSGSVIQVVHGRLSSTVVATGLSGSDYIYDIGLSASITPTSTSSNIIIDIAMYIGGDATASSAYHQAYFIYKGSSQLTESLGNAEGGRRQGTGMINIYNHPTYSQFFVAFLGGRHMDLAVGSTSSQTYSVRTRSYSGGPDIYINRSETFQNGSTDYDAVPQSTITLTEVTA